MVVVFRENESVKTSAVLRQKILDAFSENEIVFDLSSLKRIDCSVGQIILSSIMEGKKRRVKIKFRGISELVEKQFLLIGIKRQ
jgi:anti-anti-sigma regulatory factor